MAFDRNTYLESVLQTLWVNLGECCLVSVSNQLLNLWEDVSMEVKVQIGLLLSYHLRKVLPTQLIAVFKFSILIRLLLDGIVRQMH